MNSTELTNNYLSELGQRIGIKSLALNTNSLCTLITRTGFTIIIETLANESGCIFYTDIAEVVSPGIERETQLLKISQLNFLGNGTGGAVLSVNPEASFITLYWELNLLRNNYQDFENQLSQFIQKAEELHATFAQIQGDTVLAEHDDDSLAMFNGTLIRA